MRASAYAREPELPLFQSVVVTVNVLVLPESARECGSRALSGRIRKREERKWIESMLAGDVCKICEQGVNKASVTSRQIKKGRCSAYPHNNVLMVLG